MSETKMPCKYCEDGDTPAVIDRDGVLSSLSGYSGCWAHSYEDDWWPCQRKAAEEHAVVARFNRLFRHAEASPKVKTVGEALYVVIIAADDSGEPEDFLARVVEVLVSQCMEMTSQ